jgi:hypothetical protein
MNWKLIFVLSLFGLGMAFATVFWIPTKVEPGLWLVIFVICARLISKFAFSKYFLHGFLLGLVNCVWITAVHFFFFTSYLANRPEMAEMNTGMPGSLPNHPRLVMVLVAPIIGAASGLILGLFAFLATKINRKPAAIGIPPK